jgi:formamidopyrimidine-DNA glycosylase
VTPQTLWPLVPTDGPTVLVHSGMTGRPYYADDDQPEQGFERLVIALDGGELRYADPRKLRGLWLAADEDDQGPDALGLDLRSFARALRGRRGALKPEFDGSGLRCGARGANPLTRPSG